MVALADSNIHARTIWQKSRISTLNVFCIFVSPTSFPAGVKAIGRDGFPDS
jgi:hypothetical protein